VRTGRNPAWPSGAAPAAWSAPLGVLTVTVRKAEVTKPRHIQITEGNESGGH